MHQFKYNLRKNFFLGYCRRKFTPSVEAINWHKYYFLLLKKWETLAWLGPAATINILYQSKVVHFSWGSQLLDTS
jgi:hypothetical protein